MRAILTYHSIDPSGSPISVAPEDFARHVDWLARSGVAVVGLRELLALGPGADALALTFDDGFANLATAWSLLRERGLPATVFVVTERVGTTNAWEGDGSWAVPELPLLGWDALGRMAEEGLAVGAHGRRHVPLPGLSAAALAEEVHGAAQRIERELGRVARAFAYPDGLQDPAAVAEVRRGFEHACTTELRLLAARDDPFLLPRLDAYYLRAPGRRAAWGRPGFRAYVRLRAGARRVRGFVRGLRGRRRPV